MTEIKPCPICGGKATTWLAWYPECVPGATGTMYSIHCFRCGAETYGRGTKEKAIMDWNSLTKEELEAILEERIRKGEITVEEAEDEWQDWMHRTDHLREW